LNDATLIKQRLEGLGFTVELHSDLTVDQFSDLFKRFASTVTKDTAALFYYAGHGIQYKGENLFVGVNAALRSDSPEQAEVYELTRIVGTLESKARTTLVFWDACRDNPLAHGGLQGGAAALPSRSGNTLVMFSAAPNQYAIDGEDNYSPFAESLATHIVTPNEDVEDMLKRVSIEVERKTNKKQRPDRNNTQLNDFFYFNPTSPEVIEKIKKNQEYNDQIKALPPPVKRRITIAKAGADFIVSSKQPAPRRHFFFDKRPSVKIDGNLAKATTIRRMRISPDGSLLALGGEDGIIRLVNLATFEVEDSFKAHRNRVSDIDFSPNSQTLLTTGRDGTAQFWRLKPQHAAGESFRFGDKALFSGRINSAFPDKYAIFGDAEGYLYTEDLKRHQLITHAKLHQGAIFALPYQPNGKGTFFSTGHDGLIKIRRPEGQRTVIKADQDTIYAADYDAAGKYFFTAGKDRKIKVWDAKNWSNQSPIKVLEGHLKYVLTASASRTGNMLVSGGGDKAVNVWSVESGKLVAHLVGHTEDVEAVAFAPNDKFVISSSEDKSVRIWSLDNRELLVRMLFENGGGKYEGATFDNQLFGDIDADLFKIRVEDKVLSSVDILGYEKYLGRGIRIEEH
jgi:hypothetical protein